MSVDYNNWLKRLDTQLNEPTNKNSIKVSKIVKATHKKCYYKYWGLQLLETNVPSLPVLKDFLVYIRIEDSSWKGHPC